jgi:hypothetical protein
MAADMTTDAVCADHSIGGEGRAVLEVDGEWSGGVVDPGDSLRRMLAGRVDRFEEFGEKCSAVNYFASLIGGKVEEDGPLIWS